MAIMNTDDTLDFDAQELFPIRTVSEVTGVNAVTLRAWERRYGLIKPRRTPKGHRLYSQADIERIQHILAFLDRGIPVSRVRDLLDKAPEPQTTETDPWEPYKRRMLDAIARFDDRALEATYNDALSLYPVDLVTRLLIRPLLGELRERWRAATGAAAEQRFFHSYLRNKLGARFHHQSAQASGPRLVFACLPGEQDELALLLFALAALTHGYRVTLLGANTPLESLTLAVERSAARAVVLFADITPPPALIRTHLHSLTQALPVAVYVGGDIAAPHHEELTQAGAVPLPGDAQQALGLIDARLG